MTLKHHCHEDALLELFAESETLAAELDAMIDGVTPDKAREDTAARAPLTHASRHDAVALLDAGHRDASTRRLPDILIERVMAALPRDPAPADDAGDLNVLRYVPTLLPFSLSPKSSAALHTIFASAGRVAASVAIFLGGFSAVSAAVYGVNPGEMLAAMRSTSPPASAATANASLTPDWSTIASASAWIAPVSSTAAMPKQ